HVLYALIDSLGFDSVLVYSTDSTIAHYRASFSFVGSGNGDYVEDGFTANGRKYKWIQPLLIDNQLHRQGNYAPVILLASPKKNQMVTVGTELKLGKRKYSKLILEGALSNKDLNTFSSIDAADDLGYGARTIYRWARPAGPKPDSTSTTKPRKGLSADLSYEYTGQSFSQIERFREVEFSRNWNVQSLNLASDQHIAGTMLGVQSSVWGTIGFGGDMFRIGESYEGYKAKITTNISTPKKSVAQINGSYLITNGQVKSEFLRHKAYLSQEFGKLKAWFRDE
ncbi:MAG: hypothetical protein ABUL44_04120, partial [Flavobacterium sp.]